MFNREFDPYAILEKLSEQHLLLSKNQEILSNGLTEQKQFLEKLTEAHNRNVDMIKNLTIDYKDLHDRLTLIEITRMYDESTTKNKN